MEGFKVVNGYEDLLYLEIVLEPVVEHARDLAPTSIPQSSCTSVLQGLLIHLLTYLEGASLSALGIPLALSVIPPFLPESSYSAPSILSMISSWVLTCACGIP